MARVNPPLANEHAQYNPIHRVTGLFDGHDAVTSAVRDLGDAVGHLDVPRGRQRHAQRRRLPRVAVKADGPEAQRREAMDTLTRHGARDVKYWHNLDVEQGHEAQPRHNLAREDR